MCGGIALLNHSDCNLIKSLLGIETCFKVASRRLVLYCNLIKSLLGIETKKRKVSIAPIGSKDCNLIKSLLGIETKTDSYESASCFIAI